MSGVKDKLSRIRKGSAKADASASDAAPAVAGHQMDRAPSVPQAPAGGSRFGGISRVAVGDFDGVSSQPDDASVFDEDIPFDALPATPAPPRAAPPAMEGRQSPPRFGALARPVRQDDPQPQAAPAPRKMQYEQIAWSDSDRPAGSSYSIEEWEAAEEGGKNVVFEMVKPDEIGLCAIPVEAMNGVEALLYSRSLIVSEDVEQVSQWPAHASIVHRDAVLGERGAQKYRVVRSAASISKTPWLNGSVLRNDLEVAYQESKAQQPGNGRFGNVPRARG